MLDPQVQIRIIDLAAKWADLKSVPSGQEFIEAKPKYFDQAYKAILKTVQSD